MCVNKRKIRTEIKLSEHSKKKETHFKENQNGSKWFEDDLSWCCKIYHKPIVLI